MRREEEEGEEDGRKGTGKKDIIIARSNASSTLNGRCNSNSPRRN